jgi:hypothetical protein
MEFLTTVLGLSIALVLARVVAGLAKVAGLKYHKYLILGFLFPLFVWPWVIIRLIWARASAGGRLDWDEFWIGDR